VAVTMPNSVRAERICGNRSIVIGPPWGPGLTTPVAGRLRAGAALNGVPAPPPPGVLDANALRDGSHPPLPL
jgi:hypothetical protein